MEAAAELKGELVRIWQERQKLLQESALGLKDALTEAVQVTDGLTQFTNDDLVHKVISALVIKNERIGKILASWDTRDGDLDTLLYKEDRKGDHFRPERFVFRGHTGDVVDKKWTADGGVQYYVGQKEDAGDVWQWLKKGKLSEKDGLYADAFDVKYRLEHARFGVWPNDKTDAKTAGIRRKEGTKGTEGTKETEGGADGATTEGDPKTDKRTELKLKQNRKCGYCTDELPLTFHVDHVNEDPGDNSDTNLVACCPTCHDRKGRAYTNRKDYILRPMIYRLNLNRKRWGQQLVPAVWLENYSAKLFFQPILQYRPSPVDGSEDKAYKDECEKCTVLSMPVDLAITGQSHDEGYYTIRRTEHSDIKRTSSTSVPWVWPAANNADGDDNKGLISGHKLLMNFQNGKDPYLGTVGAIVQSTHIATARQYWVEYDDEEISMHSVEDLLPNVTTLITPVRIGDLVMMKIKRQTFTGIVTSIAGDDKHTVLFDNGKVRHDILEQEAKQMRLRFLLLLQEEQDAMWEVFVPRTADEAAYLTKAFTTPT